MKIVFIYENGFASNNGSNHLICATIEKMLEHGHTVDLIEAVSVRENDLYPIQLENERFKCHIIELEPMSKTNFIGRYFYGLKFVVAATKIAKKLDADLFFVQSVPTVSFTIRRLTKLGKPIVYNIHDVFPGSAYELGILKSKLLDKFLKQIQRIGFNLASKIIVVSEDMKDKLIEEGVAPDKVKVINTWYDSDSINYVENNNNLFVKENEIDTSKLIIQYAGNVGQVFGLEEFIYLVKSLKDDTSVEFHIIGSGVKLSALKEQTKECNIRFFEWQPQSRMSEVFSYCDIEIIPLHHGVIGNNVPSKMALAMACGKPIMNIVEESQYYWMFKENEIGYAFTQKELHHAINVIINLSRDKSLLDRFHDKVIEFTDSVYSKEKNTTKLMEFLEKVTYIKEYK